MTIETPEAQAFLNRGSTATIGLVPMPTAQDFLSTMELASFLNIALGDPSKYDGTVAAAMKKAHDAIKAGIDKVKRLATDESRTPAEKHYVAREIARQIETVLNTSQASIDETANELHAEASNEINSAFKTSLERSAIHAELRAFIRELSGKGDIASIRALMAESYEASSVVVHSPRVLLGMAKELHESLREYAVKTYLPEADAKLDSVVALHKVASKYPATVRRMAASFYNGAMADKYVRTRVEI